MTQEFRLARGGRIERDRVLSFRFDGVSYTGHPGDTLASALLANGVHLVARSFKYHRPRGILGAGVEEPNALVTLGEGARREPNVRATEAELFEGLVAESQNRWPSLRIDVGALAGLFAKLLPAGFYYKTFMWPGAWWHSVYEKLIRRMGGLGRSPGHPDPERYETRHAHCDLLVVGAGPAGLNAAVEAGRSGARVILADMQSELGGGLLVRQAEIDGKAGSEWVAGAAHALAGLENVEVLTRTTIAGYYDYNYLVGLQRLCDHLPVAEREGFRSVEHLKRYTTTGMGTDQSKTSNMNALGILSELRGDAIPEVGTTTFRPPFTGLTFGAVAGLDRGDFFTPQRKTPMHPWHEARGTPLECAGDWLRPWYFPLPGEDREKAVQRECLAVRNRVGVANASTLGKIDLRGPDAAEFLDRVYTNAWSRLGIGQCRYGLMLIHRPGGLSCTCLKRRARRCGTSRR